MGGLAAATGIMSVGGNIAKGRAEKRAYESEAKQAELQAEMDTVSRKRDLNDALAMQAVMFAQQGRVAGVGSAKAIQEEDIKRAGQDIDLIKTGAKVSSTGSRAAGKFAERAGITAGLIGGGKSLMGMHEAGMFSGGVSYDEKKHGVK